jgi:hypothetical protein
MAQITVKGKGNLGVHPDHGAIKAGQEYTIDEMQFADQLFERPAPDWLAPWEREPKGGAADTTGDEHHKEEEE